MLTARRKNGELFNLGDQQDRKILMKYRQKEEFFCPECKARVLLKMGQRRIVHFAHVKGHVCSGYYERESDYHLSGKLQLYQWLKGAGVNPALEPYIDEIRQRPDISFHYRNRAYVVEFQCSVISPELFRQRTLNYKRKNFVPIWILGGKNVNRKNASKFLFSHFHFLFLTKTAGQWQLPAYCPTTNQIIFLRQILPITVRSGLSRLSVHALQDCALRDLLFPNQVHEADLLEWRQELQKFRLSYSQLPHPFRNPFLQELYKNNLNLFLLPPHIGIPLSYNPFIETPPVIWQSYLFLDIFSKLNTGDYVAFADVYDAFKERVRRKHIRNRDLPLAGNGHASFAVMEYLHFLAAAQVLSRIDGKTFRVSGHITAPKNDAEQQMMEDSFYLKFGKWIQKNLERG